MDWARYRYAQVVLGATFILIVAGGLVTSTNSGLAVPDWPLSYGTFFPPMVGGIRFEHTHRLIAGAVGILTLILTIWTFLKERRAAVRRLAVAAFSLVMLQALLGGVTVLMQLPPVVSVAHACLGQTFFATMAVLVATLSPGWVLQPPSDQPQVARWLPIAATTAIYAQLIIGAIYRHSGWGLPIHVAGAALATTLIFWLANRVSDLAEVTRAGRLLSALVGIQLLLGLTTFITRNAVLPATAHVATGALLLALSATLTARLLRTEHPISRVTRSYSQPLHAYLELTKPRLTLMAVFVALGGFMLASQGTLSLGKLLATFIGTTLLGASSGALNQYLERAVDAQMVRTRTRPLPSGRIAPEAALWFGVATGIASLGLLMFGTTPLAAVLGVLTLISYLFLYTPLKRRSGLCTLVGAIPGALPPLIGWAAARGTLNLQAWLLFAILFVWQLPHFLAIAWKFREDYSRAGFQILPVLDPAGGFTFRQIVLYSMALVPISLLPTLFGLFGWIYFLGALVASVSFLGLGLSAARARSLESARRLFLGSVLYLPCLFATMGFDRIFS